MSYLYYSGSEYSDSEFTINDEGSSQDGQYSDDFRDSDTNAEPAGSAENSTTLVDNPVECVAGTATKRQADPLDTDDGGVGLDGESCTICFESWTSSGPHRLVCLRCGHLFGKSCIERWSRQSPTCPTCHTPIRNNDIRVIFARSLKMVDTAELEGLKSQLKRQVEEGKRLAIDYADSKLKCHLLELELKRVRRENLQLRNLAQSTSKTNLYRSNSAGCPVQSRLNSMLLHKSPIPQNYGGRALTHSSMHGLVIYSQRSITPLYNGHGITKVNLVDPRMFEYVPLHTMSIRDLSVNASTGTLLSCGMDNHARLVDLGSNTIMANYEMPSAAWSCAWMDCSAHYFYVGTANGSVYLFDSRREDKCVDCLIPPFEKQSPIATLQAVSRQGEANSGIFVGSLLKAGIYSAVHGDSTQPVNHSYYPVPLDASILSAHFEANTKHLSVSLRSTAQHPYIRHEIYHTRDFDKLEFTASIRGSRTASFLTRARLVRIGECSLYVCAYDEQESSIKIHDISNSACVDEIGKMDRVTDICPIYQSNSKHNPLLATISPSSLQLYKLSHDVLYEDEKGLSDQHTMTTVASL